MQHQKILLTYILLCCSFAFNAYAEEADPLTWYQIEVLIFQPKTINTSNELIQPETRVADLLPANHFLTDSDALLPNQHRKLLDVERKLQSIESAVRRSSAYALLESQTWHQLMTRKGSPYRYHINTGKILDENPETSQEIYDIVGNLSFRKSRYLHLDVNIHGQKIEGYQSDTLKGWFYRPQTHALSIPNLLTSNDNKSVANDYIEQLKTLNSQETEVSEEADLNPDNPASTQNLATMQTVDAVLEKPLPVLETAWRLQDSRRMRSGETHYIDHPMIGLIVHIEPIDPPSTHSTIDPNSEYTVPQSQ